MVKIIPTPDEEPEKLDSENSETGILRKPISKDLNKSAQVSENSESGISTYQEITDKIKEDFELVYTIDDLIDVWCRGATNGATLWQYCQETNKPLPVSFEAGLLELTNEIRSNKDKAHALQQVLNNNMILLGVFEEKQ